MYKLWNKDIRNILCHKLDYIILGFQSFALSLHFAKVTGPNVLNRG